MTMPAGSNIPRQAEPEVMADRDEALAYARADFTEVNQAFVDRLLALVGPCLSAAAVDLGTGPGDIPFRLLRARPGWHITAVDASQAMLELARRAAPKAGLAGAIDFLQADAKSTHLPAAAFDVVFSNSILHHISDTAAFWAEVRRLAAPGAVVFMRDLARPGDAAAAARIVEQYVGGESELLRQEYYRSLLSSYTVQEVRRQLDKAGLGTLGVEMATDRHLDVFGRPG